MYYASIGVLSLILHIIINHEVLFFTRGKDMSLVEIRYKSFLYSVMLYYISDILWGVLYELHIRPFAYADTVLYFISMVLSVLLWTRYVVAYLDNKNFFSKILVYAGWLIFIFELANLIYNFFKPVVFIFSENMTYEPRSARYLTLGIQIALYFVTAVYTLIMTAKTEGKTRRRHKAIGLSGLIMTAFIILQTIYPFVPFYAVGCLIAICLIYTFVAEDEKMERERKLGSAMYMAYSDSLTGVKNSHAYVEAKHAIDLSISDGTLKEFGVVVFDLNGLKSINDTLGHDAGDSYIKDASNMISEHFKNSQVYRIGGDEFVVFLEGEDYTKRIPLIDSFKNLMEINKANKGVVISCGLAEYIFEKDYDYNTIFERADRKMYEHKSELKGAEKPL